MTRRTASGKMAGPISKSARRHLPSHTDDAEAAGRQHLDVFDVAAFREIDAAMPIRRFIAASPEGLTARIDGTFDNIELRAAAAGAFHAGVCARNEADENAAKIDRLEHDLDAVRRVIGPRIVLGTVERRHAAPGLDVEPFDVPDDEYQAFKTTLEILKTRLDESRPVAGNADVFKQAFVRYLAAAWRSYVGEPGRGKDGHFVRFVTAAWRLHGLPSEEIESLGPFIRGLAVREKWVGSRAKK